MWKVEIGGGGGGGGVKTSGKWKLGSKKNVESRNCEMKWKVEIEF